MEAACLRTGKKRKKQIGSAVCGALKKERGKKKIADADISLKTVPRWPGGLLGKKRKGENNHAQLGCPQRGEKGEGSKRAGEGPLCFLAQWGGREKKRKSIIQKKGGGGQRSSCIRAFAPVPRNRREGGGEKKKGKAPWPGKKGKKKSASRTSPSPSASLEGRKNHQHLLVTKKNRGGVDEGSWVMIFPPSMTKGKRRKKREGIYLAWICRKGEEKGRPGRNFLGGGGTGGRPTRLSTGKERKGGGGAPYPYQRLAMEGKTGTGAWSKGSHSFSDPWKKKGKEGRFFLADWKKKGEKGGFGDKRVACRPSRRGREGGGEKTCFHQPAGKEKKKPSPLVGANCFAGYSGQPGRRGRGQGKDPWSSPDLCEQ